jgi:hypothetical protein
MNPSLSSDARRSPYGVAARLIGVMLIGAALIGFSTHSDTATFVTVEPAVSASVRPSPYPVGPVSRANELPGLPVGIQLADGERLTVVAVGMTDERVMELPPNPATVGWYSPGGVRPGRPGTAVFAAHVDARVHGLGPFVALHTIEPGTLITVEHDDGETSSWQVSARDIRKKDELVDTGVFTTTGAPRIALITCGGRFDAVSRSYDSNVIVTAVPWQPDTN